MNTEELPFAPLTRQPEPTIITKQCTTGGWIACVANEPSWWEFSTTEAAAIGKLHLLHQDVFGAIQREEQ